MGTLGCTIYMSPNSPPALRLTIRYAAFIGIDIYIYCSFGLLLGYSFCEIMKRYKESICLTLERLSSFCSGLGAGDTGMFSVDS